MLKYVVIPKKRSEESKSLDINKVKVRDAVNAVTRMNANQLVRLILTPKTIKYATVKPEKNMSNGAGSNITKKEVVKMTLAKKPERVVAPFCAASACEEKVFIIYYGDVMSRSGLGK